MAVLEVTIRGKLKLDDDLVEPFKAQDSEDQLRGFLDEAEAVTVTVRELKPAAKPEAAQE